MMSPIGAALLSLLVVQAAALPPLARLTPNEPSGYYGCAFFRDIGGPRLAIRATVGLDGRPTQFTAVMWGGERQLRLWRQVTWSGTTFEAMTDNASIILQHFKRRQFMGRIELRSAQGGGTENVAAGASLWSSQHDLILPWRQIDAAARAPGGLLARVTGYDGRLLGEGRLNATAHDRAVAAMRSERARLEAMIADFRTRCTLERDEEVIVT
jgi:hypothetical protein